MEALSSTHRRFSLTVCAALAVVFAHGQGADFAGLSLNQASQSSPRVEIIGNIYDKAGGIESGEIRLNDELVYDLQPIDRAGTRLTVSGDLNLRDFSNEITIILNYRDGRTIQRRFWRYSSPPSTKHWVVLINGNSQLKVAGTQDSLIADRLRQQLIRPGLTDPDHVFVLAHATGDLIADALYAIKQKADKNDDLLVYYFGPASANVVTGQPLLLTRGRSATEDRSPSVRVGDVLSDVSRVILRRSLVVLDTESDDASEPPGPKGFDGSDFRWLPGIKVPEKAVVLVSHYPSNSGSEASRLRLTEAISSMVSKRKPIPADECSQFYDLARSLDATIEVGSNFLSVGDFKGSACPVAYETVESPNSVIRDLEISVDKIGLCTLNGTIEGVGSFDKILINLNQSPVLIKSAGVRVLKEVIPIAPGKNWINVSVQSGGKTVSSLEREVDFDYPTKDEILARPASKHRRPMVNILHRADIGFSNSPRVRLDVKVNGKAKHRFKYEVHRNGTPIYRRITNHFHSSDVIEEYHDIELVQGLNNVTVEAQDLDNGNFDSQEVAIVYEEPSRMKALLVGVNQPVSSRPDTLALRYAEADVDFMKESLLKYTNLAPDDIFVLKGKEATPGAIMSVLAQAEQALATEAQESTIAFGPSDASFLFYFAGYGDRVAPEALKTGDERCLVLSGSVRPDTSFPCLRVTDLLASIQHDNWQNGILLLDTSFGGDSSRGIPNPDIRSLMGRSLESSEPSGADKGRQLGIGQVVITTADASTAYESSERGHGVLSFAIGNGLKALDSDLSGSAAELSLYELVVRAGEEVSRYTNRQQDLSVAGALQVPIKFGVMLPEIKKHATEELNQMSEDELSMRPPDRSKRELAKRAVNHITALEPDSLHTSRYLAWMLMLNRDYKSAQPIVDSALAAAGKPTDIGDGSVRGDLEEMYLISSDLAMRREDLLRSRSDADIALAINARSLRAMYKLGGLALTDLNFGAAIQRYNNILRQIRIDKTSTEASSNLTAEEISRVRLLKALALLRTKHRLPGFLELFGFLVRKPRSASDLNESWEYRIADVLLHRGVDDFGKFFDENGDRDLKMFQCQAGFYAGEKALIRGAHLDEARRWFIEATNTHETQYFEYWIAKSELARLDAKLHAFR